MLSIIYSDQLTTADGERCFSTMKGVKTKLRNRMDFASLDQGRIQDLKMEGAQGVRGLVPKIFLANLGDFLKNLAQKGVGWRPPLCIRACGCSDETFH